MKRTALLAADGFEEVEGLTVVDLLRRAGLTCDIIAVSDGEEITGSHGIRIGADHSFDAVIIPGGLRGTETLLADERVKALLQRFSLAGKLTAAVCAGPAVLAAAGILQGKKAVCYPGQEPRLTGAKICSDPVVQDGCVITSRGVGTSIPFALTIIAYLEDSKTAEQIAESIVFPGLSAKQL